MGVLPTPSMKRLLRVVRGQRVKQEIGYPRYLIEATGTGAVRLRQEPDKPLPLRQLIFLLSNNDILAWFLANHGQDPLDVLVVDSHPDNGDDGAQTPEPANGGYPFLNHKIWDNAMGAMQVDENEDGDGDVDEDENENADENEGEEEWLEAESEEKPQAPAHWWEAQASAPRRPPQASARDGTIVLDNVSIDTSRATS